MMSAASGESFAAGAPDHSLKRIAEIADSLKKEFGINNDISIKIDPSNQLGVSVGPVPQRSGEFVISIDSRFLSLLEDDEMTAAVAHELGHVWIFTHHPFLQTEALANEVAMRVVAREALKRVYEKLWAFEGTPGNIEELLGPDPSVH